MDNPAMQEEPGDVEPVLEVMSHQPPHHGQPGVLSVVEMSYTVTERVGMWWKGTCFRQRRHKKVLSNISMLFKSGQITAIIGSSGSGKTSLLDVISCRSQGKVSGKVYFRNEECTRDLMKTYASYVMQADRLSPHLTVRETLRYTAYLKLPGDAIGADVEAKVQEVLMAMGLRNVADSRVGGAIIRGISGGEKRRLTIALQLVQDPDILLLDEPTTGLDSYTARHLVSSLADMAHRGKIVVLTIHQPRSDIFRFLDQVAILSLGEIAYFGRGSEIVAYFTDLGFPCPKYTNPLDRYIDVCSVDRRTPASEEVTSRRACHIIRSYTESDLGRQMSRSIAQSMAGPIGTKTDHWRVVRGPHVFRILWVLLSRMFKVLGRDRISFFWRLTMLPTFVLFVAMFLGRLKDNQASVQDRTGLLYQCVLVPLWVAIINVIGLFPSIREVYYRESRDGLYSCVTFLTAYTIHVLPFCLVSSAIFSSLIYWICGLYPEVERFGEFFLVVFLLHYTGEVITVVLMGVYFDPQLANNTTSLIITATCIMASGFIRTLSNLPEPLQWLSWATVQKYAGEVMAANEYHKLNLTCDDDDSKFAPCVFPNGDTYLALIFPDALDNTDRNLGVIVAFLGGFFILACVTFKVRGIPNLQ